MSSNVAFRPIGELVLPVRTWNPVATAPDRTFSYIDLGSIDNERKVVTGIQTIRGAEAPSRARQLVNASDILVSTVRPNLNGVARVPEAYDGATASTGFCVLRPDTTRVDTRYLFHWLRSPEFIRDMVRKATGANYPAVSDRIIMLSTMPVPPIKEQQRIGAILDAADTLRTKRRAALAKLDTLAQSIFIEMFGEWDLMGGNDPTIEIGPSLNFLTSGSRGWASYYSDSGALFLRIQNVLRDELTLADVAFVNAPDTAEARRTRVQPGDVLLSITADLGRTAVVPDDIGEAYINQHLAILRSTEFEPRFLSAALASPAGKRSILRRNREAVKAGLNFDDIRSFQLPNASRDEQALFADRAKRVDGLKQPQLNALAATDRLFSSLQHRAFRGDL